jgi:pimeloyl-ACP methyl ester carboxylesterase
MFFTARNQPLVTKLIVVDIAPRYYEIRHQLILDALSAIDINTLKSRTQADEILKNYIPEQGIRLFLLKNLKRKSADSFEWKINLPVIREQIDQVGAALPVSSTVEVPTLFIRGSNSDYITRDDLPLISQQFPNSSVHTIAEAGHWVHSDAPELLLKEVSAFLN